MFRQKIRKWWRIRTKVFVGLFLAFVFGCVALTYCVNRLNNSRNENQIQKDIEILRDTTDVYVRQTLLLNSANNNEESFSELSTSIISDLYGAGLRHVAIYTNQGNYLSSSRNTLFTTKYMADLVKATEGKAAYTIVRDNKNILIVYFSMPAIVAGNQVGIVRYYMDYTDMLLDGRESTSTILRVTIVIFILTFIFVTLLIQMLLSPIQQLATVSNQVTDDLNEGSFEENQYLCLQKSKRRDELGDLTNNYRVMLQTVQGQLDKLSSDKNEIYALMENRKEFYDNVTHELKTPLTTIHGYAQLLQDNGSEDEELFQKGVQSILDEAERLHRMVIQLLEMSTNVERQIWMQVSITELLRDVSDAMNLKAKRYGSHIELYTTENISTLAQKERLREVFVNVLDNAIKYGDNPQTIQVNICKEDKWIKVHIINEGRGMSEQEISHIFEPFYRVDKQYSREQGSAGLGLSICIQIMKEHNGNIEVVSEAGKTTTFIIQLPYREE